MKKILIWTIVALVVIATSTAIYIKRALDFYKNYDFEVKILSFNSPNFGGGYFKMGVDMEIKMINPTKFKFYSENLFVILKDSSQNEIGRTAYFTANIEPGKDTTIPLYCDIKLSFESGKVLAADIATKGTKTKFYYDVYKRLLGRNFKVFSSYYSYEE